MHLVLLRIEQGKNFLPKLLHIASYTHGINTSINQALLKHSVFLFCGITLHLEINTFVHSVIHTLLLCNRSCLAVLLPYLHIIYLDQLILHLCLIQASYGKTNTGRNHYQYPHYHDKNSNGILLNGLPIHYKSSYVYVVASGDIIGRSQCLTVLNLPWEDNSATGH